MDEKLLKKLKILHFINEVRWNSGFEEVVNYYQLVKKIMDYCFGKIFFCKE